MPKITTRQFVALRTKELRNFFSAHYGQHWAQKVAAAIDSHHETVSHMLCCAWRRKGRPGAHETVRVTFILELEQHAESLGWRSLYFLRVCKTRKEANDRLAERGGAGDIPPDPHVLSPQESFAL